MRNGEGKYDQSHFVYFLLFPCFGMGLTALVYIAIAVSIPLDSVKATWGQYFFFVALPSLTLLGGNLGVIIAVFVSRRFRLLSLLQSVIALPIGAFAVSIWKSQLRVEGSCPTDNLLFLPVIVLSVLVTMLGVLVGITTRDKGSMAEQVN